MTIHKIPDSLLSKNHILGTILFTILFAILFLNLYIPFSDTAWFGLGKSDTFLSTVTFISVAIFVLVISRVGMYIFGNKHNLSYPMYTVWCLVEIALICWIYAEITSIVNTVSERTELEIYKDAFPYCAIALGVPYIIAVMYFIIIDKNKIIRLMNYENIVTDEVPKPGLQQKKITLCDNNGIIRMIVSLENLYYIQSDDNYVKVCYTDSLGEMQKYMLRCSLKTIEDSFKDNGLIRCSRQYIVNVDKIGSIRKESGGYILELDNHAIGPITISKKYASNLLTYFNESESLKMPEGD